MKSFTPTSKRGAAPVLPESEEQKYRQKCKDLKRRIREIEDHNEATSISISRTKRAIQRLRLERALILEKLEDKTSLKVDDSEGTPSPPSTPKKKESPGAESPEKGSVEPSEKPTKTKRNTTPRDPNLPKRPQNAYIIFCDLEKERVKQELERQQPGESFDLTRAMADAWKELSEEERKRFYEKYEDDKERYVREMAAYSSPNPSVSEQKERKRAERVLRKLEQDRGRTLDDIHLGADEEVKDEPKEDQEHHSDEEHSTIDPLPHAEPPSQDIPMSDPPIPDVDEPASELDPKPDEADHEPEPASATVTPVPDPDSLDAEKSQD